MLYGIDFYFVRFRICLTIFLFANIIPRVNDVESEYKLFNVLEVEKTVTIWNGCVETSNNFIRELNESDKFIKVAKILIYELNVLKIINTPFGYHICF